MAIPTSQARGSQEDDEEHQLSERRACSLVGISRYGFRNPPQPDQLARDLGKRIVDLAQVRLRLGYRRTLSFLQLRQPFISKLRP